MQIARVYIGVDIIYCAPTKVQITWLKFDRGLSQTISFDDVTRMTQFAASVNVMRDLHAFSRLKIYHITTKRFSYPFKYFIILNDKCFIYFLLSRLRNQSFFYTSFRRMFKKKVETYKIFLQLTHSTFIILKNDGRPKRGFSLR